MMKEENQGLSKYHHKVEPKILPKVAPKKIEPAWYVKMMKEEN